MKRRIQVFVLSVIMLFNTASFAAVMPGDIPENPRQVPASVYQTPFPADRFTTQYAPWLRNFHLLSRSENERGLYGGEACQMVRMMEASSVNPNLLYFITDTSGVWKTTDGGAHWYNTTNNLPSYYGSGLLCDKFDENTVYINMRKDGYYRSTNGGKDWQFLLRDRNATDHRLCDKIAQDDLGNVYLAASSGIHILKKGTSTPVNLYPTYASLDATTGADFKDVVVSPDGQTIAASCITVSDTVKPGLYISYDGGKTWDIKNAGTATQYSRGFSVEIHPEDPSHLFFCADIYNSEDKKFATRGLFESTDGGNTWQKNFELTYGNVEENVATSSKVLTGLEFGPKNSDGIYPLYAVGDQVQYPLRVSYDYGKSFTPIHGRMAYNQFEHRYGTAGDTGWWNAAYAVDKKNPGVVYFHACGLWKYSGGNISWIGSGYSGASVIWINMDKNGHMILSATDIGTVVGTQPYTKESYPAFDLTDPQILTMTVTDPNNSQHIIGYNGNSNTSKKELGIVESFDGGYSFSPIKEDAKTTGNTFILEYDRDDPNTIYSSKHTSHDNGKTWQKNELTILDISDKNPDKMVGYKSENSVVKLYLSRDRGKSWEYLMDGISGYVRVAFDISDDNYIWYSALWYFGRIDIEAKKTESYAEKFGKYKMFDYYTQNPKNPDHIIMLMRAWEDAGENTYNNQQVMESTDGGNTWHVVPGFWPAYMQKVIFSTTTNEAFLTGHAGTFIYSYEKYWEFLESKITVMLDNKEISFSVMPEIRNGRTMVPMRELFEMLGATVEWDGETRTVTAHKGRNSVKLQIGSLDVDMNGEIKQMEAAPYIKNSRTMVPLRFASEALGIRVGWDSLARTIYMKAE